MKNATSNPNCSRGVAKSSQEIKLENELMLLECVRDQDWIRELELSLITGMSMFTVGQIGRRLAKQGQISRERVHGNAGTFLRLKEAGAERLGCKFEADIEIPKCWLHDALAIQTLHYLSTEFNCRFKTEAALRKKTRSGKVADGGLVSDKCSYHFEQEFSRKSGKYMRTQARHIAERANEGTICFVAYPYPPRMCGGIDHETRQTNAIRHQWGSPDAPSIKLVRCHFDSLLAVQNMKASRFEIIDLPAMVDTPASLKGMPGITDQVKGLRWQMDESRDASGSRRIRAVLRYNEEVRFVGKFVESQDVEGNHQLLSEENEVLITVIADLIGFSDFVREQQKLIEAEVEADEGTKRMCAMMQEEI